LQPNLGDSKNAQANYRKSIELIQPLLAKEPDRPEYLTQWIDDQIRLGGLLDNEGNQEQALASYRAALPAAQRLARQCPANPDCLLKEADLYSELVSVARDCDAAAGRE